MIAVMTIITLVSRCAQLMWSMLDVQDNVGLPHQLHQRLQQALQKGTQLWSELVHAALMQELHKNFKGLQTDSWWHLLRCFRNLHNHHSQVYRDCPALRQSIGRTDVGAYRYCEGNEQSGVTLLPVRRCSSLL